MCNYNIKNIEYYIIMNDKKLEEPEIKSSKDLFNLILENKILVAKFSASWCGPCQSKKFKELYSNFKKNMNNIKFIEFDVDEDDDIINDKKYYDIKVNSVPYFLLAFNNNFVKEYSGTSCLEEIKNDINTLSNKKK